MAICMMCLEEVDQSQLGYEFSNLFAQADMLGPESCTEHEQVVLEGRLCSQDCYYAMQDAEFDYRERQRRAKEEYYKLRETDPDANKAPWIGGGT